MPPQFAQLKQTQYICRNKVKRDMKANELMIGDWVNICGEPKQVKEIDVRRVGIVFSKLIHAVDETQVFPIPLTAEILEKNGFECEQMEFSRAIWNTYKIADNLYIAICGEMRVCGYYVGQLNNSDYIHDMLKINYVHELQHALRLCGIDKEIVL